MKTLRYIALVMMVMFAQLSVAATKTMAQASPAPGWNVVMVDNVGTNVGHSPSIGINPVTQRPYVSYYDVSNGALRLAVQSGTTSGTCTGFGWFCRELTTVGSSGAESSLRFNPDKSGAYDIAYTNPTNAGLALYRVAANGTESNHTFHHWSNPEYIKRHNIRFVSLAYRQNQPRLAFAHSFYMGSDFGDSRASTVDYEGIEPFPAEPDAGTVDAVNTSDEYAPVDHGYSVSLDIDDNLTPRMAFRAYPSKSLRYAAMGGSSSCTNVTGNSKTKWDCAMIDTTPKTGYYITYKAPHTFGTITTKHQVAYYDATNGLVKYAQYVGGNSTCSSGGAKGWKCIVVDNVGKNNGPMGVSMTLDSKGSPVIAYYDRNDTNHGVLKIARSAGSEVGNCGPVELLPTWKCSVVDNGGTNGDDVGQMASVAVDSNDKAYIAYFNTNYQALMVAHEKSATAPQFSVIYEPKKIYPGVASTATYTIKNTNSFALSGITFAQNLINHTFVPNTVKSTCGAPQITFVLNNKAIKLLSATLPKNATCTVSVKIVGGTVGKWDLVTGPLRSNEAVEAPGAVNRLNVRQPVTPTPSAANLQAPESTTIMTDE